MSTSPDQIALTAEQKERLARLADQTGKPWDVVLGEALARYPHDQTSNGAGESFYDAAMRMGLIGCVSGGPADLSVNRQYMEGFGESES